MLQAQFFNLCYIADLQFYVRRHSFCIMEISRQVEESIRAMLLNLNVSEIKMLVEHITDEVGVEEISDLRLIQPSDIDSLLKPIQVRKLLEY